MIQAINAMKLSLLHDEGTDRELLLEYENSYLRKIN